ncbi:MAG: Asp-tRNA(Asn)/Glu-tRNA(Gln) amidotransferase subunit GatA [Desulfobulbaceae bacterium]|jgi:aspartyl-tRNA(Asn)/glutamyl-tRNA(Gln) amidotransferase subunit A|nr:Asp-tRNA(Asn)/Glu-tRNA(Gln) amidotransferase subunit GatA [Desulfobulbaceae bacterium]
MPSNTMTIAEATRAMAARQLSAAELTQSCLDRIKDVDGRLHAFISVDGEGALSQARQADADRARGQAGPLAGIPISIKDALCVKGLPATCGSKILEHFVAPYDATVIERLKAAGAVILGKVAMDEFAMGSTSETCAFGAPENPWQPGYVPGGSSGGSAVSVAAGEALASLGSDTGGSIRQPASLCGITGIKPTYGRVSRYGLIAYASSLDQVGPLCRDVADTALMLQAICGHDRRDSTSMAMPVPDFTAALTDGMKGVRIGVPKEYFGEGLEDEVAAVARQGIEALRQAGAEVVDVSLPQMPYCVAVYYLVATAEASSNLARYDGVHYGFRAEDCQSLLDVYEKSRSRGFGAEVKRRILLGTYALSAGYYDAYYKKASQVRTLIKNDFTAAFDQCDVLVSPVTPTPAWPLASRQDDPLALYLGDILTISANLAGIPAMSVPGGFSVKGTPKGLPIGIQLQAGHFQEEVLLKTAHNLEKALGIGWRPAPLV